MLRPILISAIVVTLVAGLAAPASARDTWRNDHVRHDQRVHRDTDQRAHSQGKRQMEAKRHLPSAPRGQHYRTRGDQIVRVDDTTGAVVAVLGLITAFNLATR